MQCGAVFDKRWCVALVAIGAQGCYPNTRWYEPVTAEKARGADAELRATRVQRDGSETAVSVRIRPTQSEVAIGRPRLSSPDGAPCASGVTVDSWSTAFTEQPSPGESGLRGGLIVSLPNGHADREGLLLSRPTVLDVPATTLGGTATPERLCLRVPLLVRADATPEWRQDPRWWTGIELRIDGALHRVEGIDGTVLIPISMGLLLGPVRTGFELGFGFGFGPGDPRVSGGGAGVLEVGLHVDSPLLVIHRFATGVKVGYQLEGWSYGTDSRTNESIGIGVHGPRAALRFLLLPPPPPSPKYDARPDAWSTGLEFGASLLYPFGDATPTVALGGSYFGDIAW